MAQNQEQLKTPNTIKHKFTHKNTKKHKKLQKRTQKGALFTKQYIFLAILSADLGSNNSPASRNRTGFGIHSLNYAKQTQFFPMSNEHKPCYDKALRQFSSPRTPQKQTQSALHF
ncbi:MAG: hypothetical protein ACYS1A_04190 [Planctomycetota bacterium]